MFMFFQEEEGKVLAFYTKGEEVVAVLTLGRDPLAARYKVLQSSLDMIFWFQVCQRHNLMSLSYTLYHIETAVLTATE